MKKILLGIVGALALVVIAILGLAATKPDTFRVERKSVISASAADVFANLDDFRRWAAWSPWEKLDPQMKKDYGGPPHGTGATYAWDGNNDAGKGRMTIVDSRPNERVDIHLEFIEPFPAENETTFALKPAGGGTEVSWLMTGPNSFMGKIFCVFTDMDSMIGPDFERGLANLKQTSEQAHP